MSRRRAWRRSREPSTNAKGFRRRSPARWQSRSSPPTFADTSPHGTRLTPRYARLVEEGRIDREADPTVVTEGPTMAVLDGNSQFGQVVGRDAEALLELAADLAVPKSACAPLRG